VRGKSKLLVAEEIALFKENYKIAGEIENKNDLDKIITKYDLKPESDYKSIDNTTCALPCPENG
jgi:hypothetical protein